MRIDNGSQEPIFLQVAKGIEEDIFLGVYEEESQIPSTTEISVNYRINPATVLKGINILVDNQLIYKKRGIGMFVENGAVEKIREKRFGEFFGSYIKPMIIESRKLGINKKILIEKIIEEMKNEDAN